MAGLGPAISIVSGSPGQVFSPVTTRNAPAGDCHDPAAAKLFGGVGKAFAALDRPSPDGGAYVKQQKTVGGLDQRAKFRLCTADRGCAKRIDVMRLPPFS